MAGSREIVDRMMGSDAFSNWLGIKVLEIEPGRAVLELTVRDEMTNGFGIAHGGISYSLADSALAFASNAGGIQSLSLETSIHHLKPVMAGETLVAVATQINETTKTGLYQIEITAAERRVAWFKGTVFRTGKEWNL